MILSYWTLAVALSLSLVAAWYSIAGLAAIFAAATVPIIIMGSIMEVAKITVTIWLHEYWQYCKRSMRVQLTASVVLLMFITSMGIFGFLSKAHMDQGMVSGDVQAKIAVYDEKIKTERENIDANRKALKQMDEAVDQVMGRSSDEKGAEKAVGIRRAQQKERGRITQDIADSQKKIASLNEERAPIAAEVRKVEAEVGPIKYIAALIYGDNPDANILERAVRWVIIILVLVFDPLAIMMVLASTESIRWEKEGKRGIDFQPAVEANEPEDDKIKNWFAHAKERARFWDKTKQEEPPPTYEADDGPLTDVQIEQIKEIAKEELPTGNVITKDSLFEPEQETVTVTDHEEDTPTKLAERAWKLENPGKTLKRQRQLADAGVIKQLPWEDEEFQARVLNDLKPQADNDPTGNQGEVTGFGTQFPLDPHKGDMFLRIDRLPTELFKFNGSIWIAVDKELSDLYAYDEAYIDHLISKIGSGEYDPDMLSDAERDRIEAKLKNNPPQV
jgi:hypothetical protein